MREILFRGKTKHGYWEYGFYIKGCGDHFIEQWDSFRQEMTDTPIIPETVGQYTGLYDKTGVKIFEGDIVKSPLPDGLHPNGRTKYEEQVAKVFYSDLAAAFWLAWSGAYSPYRMHIASPSKYKIIGNIHDNPELLKEGGK
jgi:uncharacterized phage protein (TIGR01671 family)